MKAIYLNQKAGPEALILGDLPQPQPRADEILVRVHATAITPTELQWYPTFNLAGGGPRPFPVVLSHEFSGVAESVGSGVAGFKPGDAVYGLNDWFSNGAQAEYLVTPASMLALKPRLLSHAQSAVVPISALTAWQALFERARLQYGQRILIHGGAGGVGMFAVQLARWRGAYVITTASAGNLPFARALGAQEVIDYRAGRFEDAVRDVDLVFDTVGGETLDRSWATLKPGGKMISVASSSAAAADPRTRAAFMLVRPDGAQLAQIARSIDDGELLVFSGGTYPLAEAPQAYLRAQQGGLRGKIALTVAEEVTRSDV